MLRNELNQQIAELNTLKSLPLNIPTPNSKPAGKGGLEVLFYFSVREDEFADMASQNFTTFVQRLVQKEKQVLQLQAELDLYKTQNPSEGRDAVSSSGGCD